MLPLDKVFAHQYSAKIGPLQKFSDAKKKRPSFKNSSDILVTFARQVEEKSFCINQYENVI